MKRCKQCEKNFAMQDSKFCYDCYFDKFEDQGLFQATPLSDRVIEIVEDLETSRTNEFFQELDYFIENNFEEILKNYINNASFGFITNAIQKHIKDYVLEAESYKEDLE